MFLGHMSYPPQPSHTSPKVMWIHHQILMHYGWCIGDGLDGQTGEKGGGGWREREERGGGGEGGVGGMCWIQLVV